MKSKYRDPLLAFRTQVEIELIDEIKSNGCLMLSDRMDILFHHELSSGEEVVFRSTITKLVRERIQNGWDDKKISSLIKDLRNALRIAEKDFKAFALKSSLPKD